MFSTCVAYLLSILYLKTIVVSLYDRRGHYNSYFDHLNNPHILEYYNKYLMEEHCSSSSNGICHFHNIKVIHAFEPMPNIIKLFYYRFIRGELKKNHFCKCVVTVTIFTIQKSIKLKLS